MASTGLLLGNLARGLVEGASPMIANIMAMHKVIKWFQKETKSYFLKVTKGQLDNLHGKVLSTFKRYLIVLLLLLF